MNKISLETLDDMIAMSKSVHESNKKIVGDLMAKGEEISPNDLSCMGLVEQNIAAMEDHRRRYFMDPSA